METAILDGDNLERQVEDDAATRDFQAYLEMDEARKKKLSDEAEENRLALEELKDENKRKRDEVLRRMLVTSSILGVGSIFLIASLQQISILALMERHWTVLVGTMLIIGASGYAFVPGIFNGANFRDVDLRRRFTVTKNAISPADAWPFPDTNSRIRATGKPTPINTDSSADLFQSYFLDLKELLEEKAADAEEKASLLLDKGTTYTVGGIIFFLISIIGWQVLAWIHGFKTEFIYGIVSCSALFIFIEFLSGWYLKQYRHYVDTSTYLLKVKAIFDRYMLAYLAQPGGHIMTPAQQRRADFMVQILDKEISWPESYLLKKAESNFAAEASSSLDALLKRARRRAR